MTLNCVSWDTEFLICQEGHYKKIVIGELIDNYMNENKDNIQKTINTDNEPTELLSIKDANILVPSVDEDGKVMWKEIEALSRHPVINTDGSDTILQITTESGRVVKATKGESFLVQKDNKIVPIRGDQLTTEDYLPLTKKLEKICEITHLDITHLFPKDQYIHSNEVQKSLSIRDNPNSKRTWYHDNMNIEFTLPYSRSDAFNERFTKIGGRRYTNFENTYQQGCLYTTGKMNKGHFPVNIPLDYDFGYLIGAYLADGCLTDNHVLVAKNDPEYFKPIEKWCDKYGIGYWHPIKKYDNPNWQDGGTIRLCSYFTVNIIKHYCGKLSHNKHIHPTLLQAPKQFHKGLIEAYIGGDGSVSRSGYIINVSSVSKQLLEDISTLLSMYNINTYYGKEVTSYYINEVRTTCNVKSNHNIHTLIIQGNNYQKFYLQFNNLPIQHKKQLLQQQYEKSLDYGTQSTKFNMIPGITCGGLDNDLIRREDVQKIPDQRLKEQLLNQQVVYDKIKEIREYKDDKHPLVYDFTVKDTLNYIPYSGICGRDSFHSAGLSAAQESTSGVPRLKELLTVTQNIKTPQNIIYLPPSKRNQMEYALDLKNKIENKYLKDVLISSEIYYDSPSNKDDYSVLEKDNNHIKNFKKFELYNNDIKKGFVLRFTLNRETMYENNIKMIDINLKLKMAYGSKITTIYNDDNDEDLFFRITLNEQTEDVIAHLKALEHSIVNHLSIKGISGINKAYYRKLTSPEKIYNKLTRQWENFEEYIIETAGSNLFEILQLPNIDKTRTISNNIREVHKIYGIEMTRALLEKSIKDVYNQSNAGMSIQHISLLVDIMTHRGNIVQIDRHGINKQDIGPLAKCAFEEVNQVITASTIFAEQEKFKGVIANVMIGQIPRQYGTGASTILMDMEEYISMASKPYKLDDI